MSLLAARQIVGDTVSLLFRGARPSRALAKASRFRKLLKTNQLFQKITKESPFRRDAETHTRDGCAPRKMVRIALLDFQILRQHQLGAARF